MVHYSLKKKYLMTKSELLSSARRFLSNHNVATTQTAAWTSNTQQVFNQSINSASYQLNVMYLFCFQRLFSCFLTRRFLHVVRTLAELTNLFPQTCLSEFFFLEKLFKKINQEELLMTVRAGRLFSSARNSNKTDKKRK